jgi:hypothetical protein
LNEELKAALAAITEPYANGSMCWANRLPEDAKELLYAIEKLRRDGKQINRRVAIAKFNELFDIPGKPITMGMIDNHFASQDKGCTCWKNRDYL